MARSKPTNAQRQATHSATEYDYERLAQAVVQAIILREKDVILKFPYFVTLSEDMPKGILIKKTDEHNYYRAKAFKLADWLFKQGYLSTNAKGVMLAQRQLVYMEARLQKMLDSNDKNVYDDVSVSEEHKEGTMQVMTKSRMLARVKWLENLLDNSNEPELPNEEYELCRLYETLEKMNQLEADNG